MRKHKRKLWVLSLVVLSLVFQVSCEDSTLKTTGAISSTFHILGGAAIAIAGLIWLFKNKIRDFIEGRKNIKLLVAALTLVLFTEGKILAADISFQPAVDTFYTIMLQFASITAGACGFFGLTRVAWLLVNEERTAGTALIMSIIGFVVATIAVGIL
jgi:hypothetical protein